jgi:hypothetical protein
VPGLQPFCSPWRSGRPMTDSGIEKWRRWHADRIEPEVLAMHSHRAVVQKAAGSSPSPDL